MSDDPASEGQNSVDEGRRNLAIPLSLGLILGSAIGSIVFAMTGEVLWIALAPGFGLTMGSLYYVIRATEQSGN